MCLSLTAVLAVCPAATVKASPAAANPFVDVSEDSVYYDAILWAYYHTPKQITGGYDATHFVPGNPCTRAQVVTFLWRAAGCPEPTGDVSTFKDAADIASPFLKAVAWAVEKGITTGFNDGTFCPNDSVTRAQFVTFLYRFEGKPATSGSISVFPDAAEIAEPYQQAVAWAEEKGITSGYEDGTFRPNDVCTRWAVLLFMYRDLYTNSHGTDYNSVSLPGYECLTLAADKPLQLSNPAGNKCLFVISLILEDGTVIWKSAPIAPGQQTDPVTPNKPLAAGVYKNCTLQYELFTNDGMMNRMNGADAKITLIVK